MKGVSLWVHGHHGAGHRPVRVRNGSEPGEVVGVVFGTSKLTTSIRVAGVDERFQEVEADAEAVADDQRRPGIGPRAHRDPHLVPDDGDLA